MVEDFPIVSASMDQEEAALAAKGSGFKSLPVVGHDQRLIGQISTKMLERVIAEEAAEDMLKLGGVHQDTRPTDSVPQIVRNRSPWLLVGLIGATIAALIIGSYEDELAKAAILAAFDIGRNVHGRKCGPASFCHLDPGTGHGVRLAG